MKPARIQGGDSPLLELLDPALLAPFLAATHAERVILGACYLAELSTSEHYDRFSDAGEAVARLCGADFLGSVEAELLELAGVYESYFLPTPTTRLLFHAAEATAAAAAAALVRPHAPEAARVLEAPMRVAAAFLAALPRPEVGALLAALLTESPGAHPRELLPTACDLLAEPA